MVVPDFYQAVLPTNEQVITRIRQSNCLNLEIPIEQLMSDDLLHIYRLLFLFSDHSLWFPRQTLLLQLLILQAQCQQLDEPVWWHYILI